MFNIHHHNLQHVIFLTFSLLTIPVSQAKDQSHTSGALLIELTGFPSDNGTAMIALCRTELEYSDDHVSFRSAKLAIDKGRAVWNVKDLPAGQYASKAYHDETNHSTLDSAAGF